MNKTSTLMIALGALATVSTGCAGKALNKRLDDKLAQESSISSRADLQTAVKQTTDAAPNLTADQHAQLKALRHNTRAEVDQLGDQSLRLRAVLIKDIISPNYDADEVELIKTRLRSVERERLNTIFSSVEKANNILGRQALQSQRVMDEMFDEPRGGHAAD